MQQATQTTGQGVRSIQFKILTWMGLSLLIAASVLILYSSSQLRKELIQHSQDQAQALADSGAGQIKSFIEAPINTARTLALSLSAKQSRTSGTLSRSQVNAMLRKVLAESPNLLGTYTLWEPNEFDGLDASFANTSLHDSTGRFIPYWVRNPEDNTIIAEPLQSYEDPVNGYWYVEPRGDLREKIYAPLVYPVQGKEVIMASFIVPIIQNERFVGIVGVDAPLTYAQTVVDQVALEDESFQTVLLNNEGIIIAARNQPELVYESGSRLYQNFESDLLPRIISGERFVTTSSDGDSLLVFSPITVGNTGNYWSFGLIIPLSIITQPATTEALRQSTIGAGLIVLVLGLLWVLSSQITRPIKQLTESASAIAKGNLDIYAEVDSNDEVGILAGAFNQMVQQINTLVNSLEKRVAERTSDLAVTNQRAERRARQFEAITQVVRVISQTQSLQDLLPQITKVISQQFDFYHVGIFLMDPNEEFAVLAASNSEGGERMLARSHRLRVGQGIVGNVAVNGIPRIALDTGSDAIYFNNPDLPATRSEIALPLKRGSGQILGVLDVQSTQPDAFSAEDVEVLNTLADQVSLAIINAQLYEDTQKAVIEAEMFYRRDLQMGWSKFTKNQNVAGIRRKSMRASLYTEPMNIPGAEVVLQTGNPYRVDMQNTQITLPVKLRGEVVGVLGIKTAKPREWTKDEMDIISAILERAALAIENARLLAESRKVAEKERIIGEISTKVSSFTNRENILQTAVAEIGRALPGAEIVIQLSRKDTDNAED